VPARIGSIRVRLAQAADDDVAHLAHRSYVKLQKLAFVFSTSESRFSNGRIQQPSRLLSKRCAAISSRKAWFLRSVKAGMVHNLLARENAILLLDDLDELQERWLKCGLMCLIIILDQPAKLRMALVSK
jgi:hypothetical protein